MQLSSCNIASGRVLLLALAASTAPFVSSQHYGVDVSFPIHHGISTNYDWLPHNVDPANNPVPKKYEGMPVQTMGDKAKFYEEFINGCKEYYGEKGHACESVERGRLAMSVRQPQSVVNYTDTGFKKIRAPEPLWKLLKEFWNENKDDKKTEKWSTGYTYTNHWLAPTYMVSIEDTSLRGAGNSLKHKLWEAARPTIEEWTGMELTPSSLYGIRVYTEGAILAPHVDRVPLISSAIINVAQDVDEDWPLEVYGRDGMAYNVTMEPGDMVLYESHSLIHGRVFPLKGRYYANIFIHFEPTSRPLRPNANAQTVSRRAARGGNTRGANKIPPYILEGSPEEDFWLRTHQSESPAAAAVPGSEAHQAAAVGDYDALVHLATEDKDALHAMDQNGWQPIHEAARGGHKNVVALLVAHGADVNARTGKGSGATPLHWVKKVHGKDHPLAKYLMGLGASDIGPEL